MLPGQIAELVLAAIRAEQFYVLPHQVWLPLLQARADTIGAGNGPHCATPRVS